MCADDILKKFLTFVVLAAFVLELTLVGGPGTKQKGNLCKDFASS